MTHGSQNVNTNSNFSSNRITEDYRVFNVYTTVTKFYDTV